MKKLLLLTITLLYTVFPTSAASLQFLGIDELKEILHADKMIILDVRSGRDWSTSEFKIPGAIRADSNDFHDWQATLPKDKKIVLYCA